MALKSLKYLILLPFSVIGLKISAQNGDGLNKFAVRIHSGVAMYSSTSMGIDTRVLSRNAYLFAGEGKNTYELTPSLQEGIEVHYKFNPLFFGFIGYERNQLRVRQKLLTPSVSGHSNYGTVTWVLPRNNLRIGLLYRLNKNRKFSTYAGLAYNSQLSKANYSGFIKYRGIRYNGDAGISLNDRNGINGDISYYIQLYNLDDHTHNAEISLEFRKTTSRVQFFLSPSYRIGFNDVGVNLAQFYYPSGADNIRISRTDGSSFCLTFGLYVPLMTSNEINMPTLKTK